MLPTPVSGCGARPYVIYDIELKEKISVLNVNHTAHFAGSSGNTGFTADPS